MLILTLTRHFPQFPLIKGQIHKAFLKKKYNCDFLLVFYLKDFRSMKEFLSFSHFLFFLKKRKQIRFLKKKFLHKFFFSSFFSILIMFYPRKCLWIFFLIMPTSSKIWYKDFILSHWPYNLGSSPSRALCCRFLSIPSFTFTLS